MNSSPSYKTTFVSACFNCNKSEFFTNRYLRKSLRTLVIPCPLIIYCEEDTAHIYRTIRSLFHLEHITYIVEVKLEDLYFYKYKSYLTRGEAEESNYNKNAHIVMLNKFKFMLDSIEENRFNTTHFGWIDINLLDKTFNNSVNYLDNEIFNKILHICQNPKDKFSIQVINKWTPDMYADLTKFYSRYQWIVAGCFLTTDIASGKIILPKLIEKSVEISMIGHGSTEESMYSFIIDENTDLFNLSVGDYQDAVHNYYKLETNRDYVLWVVNEWKNSNRDVIFRNIQKWLLGN